MEIISDFHSPKFTSPPADAAKQPIENDGKQVGSPEAPPQSESNDKVVEKKND